MSSATVPPARECHDIPTNRVNASPNASLFFLPTELVLDILDYICPSIAECEILQNHLFFPSERRARFHALRALSQTCQVWRSRFLPLLWHRLEVCTIASGLPEWKYMEEIGPALFTKSNGLLESEYLWSYVQIVTVTLVPLDAPATLGVFARCLSVLPNLHTIEVVHAKRKRMGNLIREAFKGMTYPTVRTLTIPHNASGILRSCPEVERLSCTGIRYQTRLISAMIRDGNPRPKLTTLCELPFGGRLFNKKKQNLGKIIPNLTSIEVGWEYIPGALSEFKHLSTVQFNVFLADLRGEKLDQRLANALEQKRDICNALKALDGNQRKWLSVIYYALGSWNVKFEMEEVT